MLEYEDEFDELLEEDEEDLKGEFNLGHSLPPPTAKLYTTKDLHKLIHEGVIDLNPPYQRAVVWPENKQIKLLDSIWRNYYVPPVVFAVYMDDGEEVRCCVDGKQRLTSIQKFFDGQIPYKHWKTGKNYWYTSSQSQKTTRLQVPKPWRDDFSTKQITCVEYHGLPQQIERDIFQRVQLGVALTAAEKLQAIDSPWTEWISDLQARFVWAEDGLTQHIDVAIKRGQDFQLIAGLIYCCDNYGGQPLSKNLDKWLSRPDPPPVTFKNKVLRALTTFWHLANDPELNRGFREIKKRVAPAEFVFIGVLLYWMEGESDEVLAEAIYNMRVAIREKHPDIRLRTDIIRDLWLHIEEVVDGAPAASGSAPAKSTAKKGKKRKQKVELDEDGMEIDEYRPGKQGRRKL